MILYFHNKDILACQEFPKEPRFFLADSTIVLCDGAHIAESCGAYVSSTGKVAQAHSMHSILDRPIISVLIMCRHVTF